MNKPLPPPARSARGMLLALTLVPVAAVGIFVGVYGQPVPFWDEWVDPLDVALKTAEGNLALGDLFRQYNDSRPVFTNLLTVASVHVSAWDLRAQMFFNMSLALLTLGLLFAIYRRQDGRGAFYVLPLFSLLTFSLTQEQSWLWAIQSQYFFLILFLVAALWMLEKEPQRWCSLAGAAVFSLCATFSYANGFLIWPTVLLTLWMLGYRKASFYVFWLAAGGVAMGLFFHGYDFRGREWPVPSPWPTVEWILAFLGNALVGHGTPAAEKVLLAKAIGFFGLLLFVINALYLRGRCRQRRQLAVWIGLAAFVLASAGLAAVGRSSTSGLAGRYATLSSVFWIASLGLGARAVGESCARMISSRASRALVTANATAAVVLTGVLLYAHYHAAGARPRVTEAHRACLEAVPVTRDVTCLEGLHPVFDPDHPSFQVRYLALEKIDRLAALGLGVFAPNGGRSSARMRKRERLH